MKLDPYQIEAVDFLDRRNGTGLLADEMGLGKTIEAIGYMKRHPELRPVLVICPATAKYVWEAEIRKWLKIESQILNGESVNCDITKEVTIVNYDILAKMEKGKDKPLLNSWVYALAQMKYKIMICDEAHYISSEKAIRTRAVIFLKKHYCNCSFIPISGTPILSYPNEFFTVLNLLDEKTFPNRYKYYYRYCAPKHNGFGWTFKGVSNIEELYDKVKPLMIRRKKSEVLKDLPAKRRIVVPLELSKVEKQAYIDADKEFIEWVESHSGKNSLALKQQIENLKQLAYMAKRNSVINWIEDYLHENAQLVVFAYHTKAINDLCAHFKNIARKIDGSVDAIDRKKIEDEFQSKKDVKLIVGQIKAAGTVLTLTAANAVAFVEFGWTSGEHVQAEDRVHRRTQEADSIFAYYLVAKGTVEDKIAKLIKKKHKVLSKVLDGDFKCGDFFEDKGNFLPAIVKGYKK